ncbi:MAG: hypothetical protein AAGJ80_16925 [Cyanobacteria bacterium J06553_1]
MEPLRKRLKVTVEDSGDHLSPLPTGDLPDDRSSNLLQILPLAAEISCSTLERS